MCLASTFLILHYGAYEANKKRDIYLTHAYNANLFSTAFNYLIMLFILLM